jgi:DNA-binding protein HU-beta
MVRFVPEKWGFLALLLFFRCPTCSKVAGGSDSFEGRTMEKPAKAAAKAETVSTRQLANQLAEKHDMTNKQAGQLMDDLVGLITKHLKKGARIRLNGLGILQVRKRAARMGRNPATGEPIKIKASKKVAFRVAKELKTSI